MKKLLAALCLILFCSLLLTACGGDEQGQYTKDGKTFVEEFFNEDYDALADKMNDTMKDIFTPEVMATTHEQIIAVNGEFKSIDDVFEEESTDYTIVYVNATFANQQTAIQLAYDAEGKVAGMHTVPTYEPPADDAPAEEDTPAEDDDATDDATSEGDAK